MKALLLLLATALPARADFVLNNLRHILYHEVAHAVIDQWEVPLFGPEETAADGFALLAAHRLHGEAAMRQLAEDVVRLARIEAGRDLFDPWSDYMPGAQRTAWAICVYYGLAPDRRLEHARALGLPTARVRPCAEAGDRVRRAWGVVFDAMAEAQDGTRSLRIRSGDPALRAIKADVARLDRLVHLPRPVPVAVETCGEDNAFYYHHDERIAFCQELLPTLLEYRQGG